MVIALHAWSGMNVARGSGCGKTFAGHRFVVVVNPCGSR